MQFHLVGGFLGSGKTTAIIAAARLLIGQNKRVGIVTNDQGKYLVDTAFFRAADLPTVEVTGGCFCCNYDDLEARLRQLKESVLPDIIFAESVGSCADIVATVVKPFLDLQTAGISLNSFSVFADIRLLRRHLLGQPMPFGDDIVYIFDKQIEEAGLLVLNKADLYAAEEVRRICAMTQARYPSKAVHVQDSRSSDQVADWLDLIRTNGSLVPQVSLDIDYKRYGNGEGELAWLDEAIRVTAPDVKLRPTLLYIISQIHQAVSDSHLPIGHIKFHAVTDSGAIKISLPSLEDTDWQRYVPEMAGNTADILINARVQTDAETLRRLIRTALDSSMAQCNASYEELDVAYFQPSFPKPTYRMD